MYSNFITKVPIAYTVATSNTTYYAFTKACMRDIADALGEEYVLLTYNDAADGETFTVYTDVTIPKKYFCMICHKDDLTHGFFFLRTTNYMYVLLADATTNTWKQRYTVFYKEFGYVYIRNVSEDIKMIIGYPNYNPSGTLILANGVDQEGTKRRYLIARYDSTVYYRALDLSTESGSIPLNAGRYSVEYADFIGLQKLVASDLGIVFDDVYIATHTSQTYPNVTSLDGKLYASDNRYLSGSSIYMMYVECPDN